MVYYLRKEEFIYILIKWKINGNILLFEMNFNDSILEFRDHNWRFFHVLQRCDSCQRAGATVGCCTRGCPANYHFMCARLEQCLFQEDKKVFCPQHTEKVDGEVGVSSHCFVVLLDMFIYTFISIAHTVIYRNFIN